MTPRRVPIPIDLPPSLQHLWDAHPLLFTTASLAAIAMAIYAVGILVYSFLLPLTG